MRKNNIVGYESERKEIEQLKNMLANAELYRQNGMRIPRGLVLYGEPGVGKSVMARSMADSGLNLVELRAGNCCENMADKAIRSAFKEAKEKRPSILLLDELDKIAGESDRFFMQGNSNVKKILLQELDKLSEDDDVLVVATCNDTDCLGEALLRPGRFDRQIEIDVPDEKTREKIIAEYFDRIKIKKDFTYDYLAHITNNYTGARIECLANETGIRAFDNKQESITIDDIRYIMNRMAFEGLEKAPIQDENERRKIAVHEAGHAYVTMKLAPDTLFGASVLPQGDSEGHTRLVRADKHSQSIKDVENEVAALLAGRVAQRIVYGETFLGAEQDLRFATQRIHFLVAASAAYGYDYAINTLGHSFRDSLVSEESKHKMSELISTRLAELDKVATEIIENNREEFDRLVDALNDKLVLSRDELFETIKAVEKRDKEK